MKKSNKKGFTLVELVIVIAVIAILAAVLIPTFASVIKKAKKSAAETACSDAAKVIAAEIADGTAIKTKASGDQPAVYYDEDDEFYLVSGKYVYKYSMNGGLVESDKKETDLNTQVFNGADADADVKADLEKLSVKVYVGLKSSN